MKHQQHWILACLLAIPTLILSPINAPAQNKVVFNSFADADEVADTANGGANAWQNWFGTAFYNATWDASDASNNPSSGSLKIEAYFPDAGIGGQFGPQFFAINGYNGYVNGTYPQGIPGNGNVTPGIAAVTNVEYDIRFDSATTLYDTNNNLWPWITVGTRGGGFSQLAFGNPFSSYSRDNTNWVHVSQPIAVNAAYTNIPNIYFAHFDNGSGYISVYVDNITFTFGPTNTAPTVLPSPTIQAAKPALRLLSGPAQYNRTQVATVDTNQSWVGGSYPVSYSFTISGADAATSLDEFHAFLIPVNYNQGGLAAINQFTDYSTASNVVRLQITGGPAGVPAYANVAWKTNLIGANPDHIALSVTNNSLVGTWTMSFTSATAGTLTAPGASPQAFSIDADAAATFANPLIAFFGVQPNPTANLGQYVDLTSIQSSGVAAPGVPVNSLLDSSGNVDTNVWRTASVSADGTLQVAVKTNSAFWLSWQIPDYGAKLATAPNLAPGTAWKSPAYYTGYDSNAILQKVVGTRSWTLLPQSAMPTVNALSNGVPSPSGFFRMQLPAPAE